MTTYPNKSLQKVHIQGGRNWGGWGLALVNFENSLKIRYSLFTVAPPHKKFASAHPAFIYKYLYGKD